MMINFQISIIKWILSEIKVFNNLKILNIGDLIHKISWNKMGRLIFIRLLKNKKILEGLWSRN